ncbi:hypothetical protein EEL32_10880 [Brevibacillus laterosporus]|nr:hypothetical protein [Brevibacillus laterosporus]TPG87917.1 hypothetical protein EEL32_10880 [Brevibacillus laterosporus]
MNKTILTSSAVALILAIGSTTIPVHAEENINAVSSEVVNNFELTAEQKEALEFYEEYKDVFNEDEAEPEILSLISYDDNQIALRQGNVIEAFLNEDEGLGLRDMKRIKEYGDEAKDTAKKYYKNDSQLEDAYRHFLWNYLSVNDSRLGKVKTRVATTNHEWGLLLRNDALDYYGESLSTLIKMGMSSNAAISAAFADTLNELPKMKKKKISSFSDFKRYVDDANVMDWNNNEFGRYYSYIKDKDDAFKQATPFLILAEKKVSSSDYRKVYDGGWWK